MATVDEILLAAENNEEDADGCELRLEDILNEDESQFDLSYLSTPNVVEEGVAVQNTESGSTSPRNSSLDMNVLQQILDDDENEFDLAEFLGEVTPVAAQAAMEIEKPDFQAGTEAQSDETTLVQPKTVAFSAKPSRATENGLEETEEEDCKGERQTERSMSIAGIEVEALLSYADTEILSPLEMKRRVRKAPYKHTKCVALDGGDESMYASSDTFGSLNANQSRTPSSANVLKLDDLTKISKLLKKNAAFKHNGTGLPTAMAPHSKFIAVGTSHSLVIVFDHFQEVRVVLGVMENSEDGAVTSVDFPEKSDEHLVSGYQSGKIVLWDILSGKELKVIVDAHSCPIIGLRFWPGKRGALSLVSLDIQGRINLLTFGKRLFTWTVDRQCLINERTGAKVSMGILPSPPKEVVGSIPQAKVASFRAAFELLVFTSHSATFIVALHPEPTVLKQWTAPSKASQEHLPCLAVSWAEVVVEDSDVSNRNKQPVICRGWDRWIECMTIGLQRINDGSQESRLRIVQRFVTDLPVVHVEWVDARNVVYMNIENYVCILDVVNGVELEAVDMSGSSLVYGSLPRKSNQEEADGSKPKPAPSFLNTIRCCDSRLYFLGCNDLSVGRMQSWIERVRALQGSGQWIDALLLGLEQYRSCDDKSTGQSPSSSDDLIVADLLMEYVDISLGNDQGAADSDARGPYRIVAEVCLDYCTSIKRDDLLFGPIYNRFIAMKHEQVFLEVMEPYILADRLQHVPATVMKDFVSYFQSLHRLEDVEKCVLHLDVQKFDIDGMVRLCVEHHLFDALIYIFNRGVHDYGTPIKHLLSPCFQILDAAVPLESLFAQTTDLWAHEQARICAQKLSVYVSCIMDGKLYPAGTIPEEMASLARQQVLDALLSPDNCNGLKVLLLIDVDRAFQILRLAFCDSDYDKNTLSRWLVAISDIVVPAKYRSSAPVVTVLEQRFSAVVIHFAVFVAELYAKSSLTYLPLEMVKRSLEILVQVSPAKDQKKPELMVVEVIRACQVHRENQISDLVEDVKRFQAQLVQSKMLNATTALFELLGDAEATVNAYLNCVDLVFQAQVFSYVADVIVQNMDKAADAPVSPRKAPVTLTENFDIEAFKQLILKNLSRFVDIDQEKTTNMIQSLFKGQSSMVLSELSDPVDQYNYLHHLISPPTTADHVPVPVSSEMYDQYIRLLCQFDKDEVVRFLKRRDGYSLDSALAIVREFEVADATAFLLERTGDVSAAWSLLLAFIKERLSELLEVEEGESVRGGSTTIGGALDTLIGMSERNEVTQETWFEALDMFLGEQRAWQKDSSKRTVITGFVRKLLQAMKAHVSLSSVLMKMTNDHRKQPFGEFRSTISTMLADVKYERDILGTVNSLQVGTTHKNILRLHKLKVGAATFIDTWDVAATGGSVLDDDKRKQRKMMNRYRKRVQVRNKPLFELYERNTTLGTTNMTDSRSLLALQP
jgi:hypothetical protein